MITEEERKLITSIDEDILFKKKVTITKLMIGIVLVISILIFAYINYSYAKDINEIRSEYGENAWCYLCGYENLRRCECISNKELKNSYLDFDEFRKNIGEYNIEKCKIGEEIYLNNSFS